MNVSTRGAARVVHLLLNDLWLEARGVVIFALSIVVVSMLIWGVLPAGSVDGVYDTFLFPVLLLFGGAVFAARSFRRLHAPRTAIDYLMVPARTVEKLLSRLLQTCVLYPVAVAVVCVCASGAVMGTRMVLGQPPVGLFNPFTEKTLALTLVYLVAHAPFLAGGAFFAHRPLFKTMLVGVGFVLLSLLYVVVLGRVLFDDMHQPDWVRVQRLVMVERESWAAPLRVLAQVLWYASAPFFWVVTYLRIRETEV